MAKTVEDALTESEFRVGLLETAKDCLEKALEFEKTGPHMLTTEMQKDVEKALSSVALVAHCTRTGLGKVRQAYEKGKLNDIATESARDILANCSSEDVVRAFGIDKQ